MESINSPNGMEIGVFSNRIFFIAHRFLKYRGNPYFFATPPFKESGPTPHPPLGAGGREFPQIPQNFSAPAAGQNGLSFISPTTVFDREGAPFCTSRRFVITY